MLFSKQVLIIEIITKNWRLWFYIHAFDTKQWSNRGIMYLCKIRNLQYVCIKTPTIVKPTEDTVHQHLHVSHCCLSINHISPISAIETNKQMLEKKNKTQFFSPCTYSVGHIYLAAYNGLKLFIFKNYTGLCCT